jgi:hypothetical protein
VRDIVTGMRVRHFERFGLRLVVGLLAVACAGSSASSSADSAQQAIVSTGARLEGDWTLVDFQPAQPLEPMFAALLTAQMNQMRITFHDSRMTVQGIGVSAERTINVTQAAADGFDAVITDPTNVSYQVSGAFQGRDLAFTSKSDPWRGQGRLRRAR